MAPLTGVETITPASPEFTNAVQSLVDPAILPDIQSILAFCYVLRNNSAKTIIVYSTRWALTDGSGRVISHDSTWWNLATLQGGDAIGPGASRFVSPIFRLGMSRVGPTGPALALAVQRTLAAFAPKAEVDVSLETVVFSDGIALGRDATNAVAQARGYLDAERQLSDLISQTSAAGGDVAQLLTSSMPARSSPPIFQGSNPPGYDDTLSRHRQVVVSLLLKRIQVGSPNPVEAFQRNIAMKRYLTIVPQ